MHDLNDSPFPPKYFIPIVLPDHGVPWQRWFWRSWRLLIVSSIAMGWTVGGGLVVFAALGLLIGVVLGFWVSVFSTIGLFQRQFERHPAFWFSVHYAAWAAIMAWVFSLLTSAWHFWQGLVSIQIGLFYLPMAGFIVVSSLVGWYMYGWFNIHRLNKDDALSTV